MLVAVFQAVLVSMIALQQGSLQHCKAQRGRLCAAGCRGACSDEDARLVAKTVARDLWYSATVAKVNADGTLDVQYDDGGEQEAAVMVSMVRPARARQAGASFTEGQRIEALYGSVTASARREMCARRCERGLKGKAEVGYVAACTAPEIAMGIPLSRHRQQHVYGRLEGVGRLLRPLRRRGGRGGAAANGELAGDDEWSGEGCPTAELGDAHVEGVLDGIFYGRAGARLPRSNRLLPQDQRDREAVDARAAQLGGGGTGCSEATYGEIPLASLLEALASPLVNMTSKDAFLDIGAGLGKHPLSVALFLRARRAAGVEFSHARFEASCAALRAAARVGFARAAARVEYVRGDAMALDLEPFDVVFTYSLCFRAPMVEALALQVLTYLLAYLLALSPSSSYSRLTPLLVSTATPLLQMRRMRLGSRIVTASYAGLSERARTSTFGGRLPDTVIEYAGTVRANLNRYSTQGLQDMRVYRVVARSARHGAGETVGGRAVPPESARATTAADVALLDRELVDVSTIEEAVPLSGGGQPEHQDHDQGHDQDQDQDQAAAPFLLERREGPSRCAYRLGEALAPP